jgi:hypothetical protein
MASRLHASYARAGNGFSAGATMKRTKYAFPAAFGLIVFLSASVVRANSIVYEATGTFSNGTSTAADLSGTVSFDATTGLVTSASLLTTGSVALGPLNMVLIQHPVRGNSSLDTVGIFDASTDDGVSLVFPMLSSFGFRPIVILCGELPLNCGTTTGFISSDLFTSSTSYPLAQGAMTLVPSPEPAPLVPVGMGLFALAATAFRTKRPALRAVVKWTDKRE